MIILEKKFSQLIRNCPSLYNYMHPLFKLQLAVLFILQECFWNIKGYKLQVSKITHKSIDLGKDPNLLKMFLILDKLFFLCKDSEFIRENTRNL